MFIGYDLFNYKEDGTTFQTKVRHGNYIQAEFYKGLIDDIYMDNDINFQYEVTKPNDWNYSTILHAKFDNTLEAGNISGQGYSIESLRVQKRKVNESTWIDVAQIPYTTQVSDYEVYDRYVANQEEYVYSLLPLATNILGHRISSEEIKAEFEGIFFCDKNSNYQLLYNIEYGDMTHNVNSSTFEPLDSKYPVVAYSNMDYVSFPVNALFVSVVQSGNDVDIRSEKVNRENLMNFIKNKKPKIYKDSKGELRLVTIVGKPTEKPVNGVDGIANLSFDVVEIGDVNDSDVLSSYGLLEGLGD